VKKVLLLRWWNIIIDSRPILMKINIVLLVVSVLLVILILLIICVCIIINVKANNDNRQWKYY